MSKMKAPIVLILFILSFQGASAQRKDMLEVEPFSLLHDSIFHWKMTEIEEWYFQLAESDENVSAFSWKTELGVRVVRCAKTLEYGLVEHIWIIGEKPKNSYKNEMFSSLHITIESAGSAKRKHPFYKNHKDMIRGCRIIRSQKFWWNYYHKCLFYLDQILDLQTYDGSGVSRKHSIMSFESNNLSISLDKVHYDFRTGAIIDQIDIRISKI